MKIRLTNVDTSIMDLIGNTRLLQLKIHPIDGNKKILAKLEFTNPTGSLKDRIYIEMISSAIRTGELEPEMEILEASTGNAGIACSFVGKMKGFRVTIVMPEGMSEERKQMITAFGAQLILTPGGESDVDLCTEKILQMMKENRSRYWFPDQFSNPNNPLAHYKGTGPEIWNQTEGKVDCFVAACGTGGTITGIGRYLREKNPRVKLYVVEPSEAPIIAKERWGQHRVEGIGDGFIPKNLDLSILDGVVTVSTEESLEMARRLLTEEGIFCGISSGCNVAAALKVANKHSELGAIVTMINDSGNRYLSTELFGRKKQFNVPDREHKLDDYTKQQLNQYRDRLEIIE